jgi:6-phosphogluconolactonase (cycloisomerase 2 family)
VRASDGKLTYSTAYATGGTGTGGGLGNQGAVILAEEDDNVLLAVNPGSNSISSFKVSDNGLQLKSTVNSGGMRPVSITQHGNIVYVLNAGGAGNISGFKLSNNNKLNPIANSERALSSSASGAAQISFVNEGRVLVITEKATNKIITYTVNEWGIPGTMHSITSANATPFGFAAGKNGNIFVSEAAGGAAGASTLSSYRVYDNGVITLTKGPVGANQSAACWVVITDNGKYAYTTNTASNNISNFNVSRNTGNLSVNTAIAATTGMGPIDAALSNNSKYLYTVNAGSHTIGAYAVANNGSLSSVQIIAGLPVGATGLAAR